MGATSANELYNARDRFWVIPSAAFRVVATNAAGSTTSNPATLTVSTTAVVKHRDPTGEPNGYRGTDGHIFGGGGGDSAVHLPMAGKYCEYCRRDFRELHDALDCFRRQRRAMFRVMVTNVP